MKHTKLEPMTYGWQELVKLVPSTPPEGYSNVDEIAKKVGASTRYINSALQKLYRDGKIDRVEIRNNGRLKYYYKD